MPRFSLLTAIGFLALTAAYSEAQTASERHTPRAAPTAPSVIPASDGAPFELAMTSSGNGLWAAVRYSPTTGRSWLIFDNHLILLEDTILPPRGRYRILLATTKNGFGAIRYDALTGRTWVLLDRRWMEQTSDATPTP